MGLADHFTEGTGTPFTRKNDNSSKTVAEGKHKSANAGAIYPSALADLANCVLKIPLALQQPSSVAMTLPSLTSFMPHFGAPALLLLQLLAALPATAAETDATPLRFSVMESWSMPLVRLQRGQPIDGIVYDITRSLARQVGRKALYHPTRAGASSRR